LRCPTCPNGSVRRSDVANEGIVDHDRQIAGHLELVAAADADPVDARERRLAHLAQAVVSVLESPEPLPVLAGVAEVILAPGLEVGADGERAPRSSEDDSPNGAVPGSVRTRPRDLAQPAGVA